MAELKLDDLAQAYDAPRERSVAKDIGRLDHHMRRFIQLSPFCVLASVGADGSADVTPRGGAPGFIKVEGPNTLVLPDRPGNNRLDTLRNIAASAGEVALLFFLPGMDETLRIAGRAAVVDDPALLAQMVEFGKTPRTALRIEVREAFLHCAKALMRSKLWDPGAHVDRSIFPSLGEMIHEQTGVGASETQKEMLDRYAATL